MSLPVYLTDAAWLVFQLGVGYLFMSAAWGCWRFKDWTIAETSLMFAKRGRFLAYCGMGIMAVGGAAVFVGAHDGVAGFVTRGAALALSMFVLFGAKIHALDQAEARRLQTLIKADSKVGSAVSDLANSAVFAHVANVNKNRALAAVCLFLAFGPKPDVSVWSCLKVLLHLG